MIISLGIHDGSLLLLADTRPASQPASRGVETIDPNGRDTLTTSGSGSGSVGLVKTVLLEAGTGNESESHNSGDRIDKSRKGGEHAVPDGGQKNESNRRQGKARQSDALRWDDAVVPLISEPPACPNQSSCAWTCKGGRQAGGAGRQEGRKQASKQAGMHERWSASASASSSALLLLMLLGGDSPRGPRPNASFGSKGRSTKLQETGLGHQQSWTSEHTASDDLDRISREGALKSRG
ncbi:hypothetical protein AXG93_3810s1250 [Marchantia polymorpha subsp. ruderalis]|uniref:Uncharacterized protein n=1 Tax=Marchantia polymorpha subsp. ruderalis TaxID=1480154 RepID=A0A176VCR2_MARPO|nr:hypothetical protein AXG93_3810s1250 [Marchantia polymorpha subsp. ruderalis]